MNNLINLSTSETSRRSFLRTGSIGLAALATSLLPNFASGQDAAAVRQPNVIVIVADDLGYGDLGSYGQTKIQTPFLDQMAQEGTRFTDAYSGSPVCGPSRSCMLTGQHTGHTPVRGNPAFAVGWDRKDGDTPLPEDAVTFAEVAKSAGYETACIGKWGLGHPGTSGDPLAQGFDYHFGYLGHGEAHNYYPKFLWRNGKKVPLEEKQYSHDLLTEDALRWVREQGKDPFVLYLAYTIPHFAIDPPSLEPYEDTGWEKSHKGYAAMVTRMDRDIGRLMALLREIDIAENTLVIFTSDNGTHGEGGYKPVFLNSNGPLRGIKRAVYEGGIRVPMLAWWPGTVPDGAVTNHVTAGWDILPTIAELSGGTMPDNIDGISFVPVLKGDSANQRQHEYLYWEFVEQNGKQAVRMGDWKGVRLNVSRNPDAPVQLFNLKEDVGEKKNIAKRHPDIVKRILEIMDEAHTPSMMFPLLPEEGPVSPRARKGQKKAKKAPKVES